MNGQDGVPGVVFLVEKSPELAVGQTLFEPPKRGLGLGPDAFALGEELDEDVDLILLVLNLAEELEVALEPLFLLLEGLGGLLVLPDFRRGQAQVDRIALGSFMIDVKENPAALRTCRSRYRGAS
jgi:hypothetical protein